LKYPEPPRDACTIYRDVIRWKKQVIEFGRKWKMFIGSRDEALIYRRLDIYVSNADYIFETYMCEYGRVLRMI
jgi:hypothetical protein